MTKKNKKSGNMLHETYAMAYEKPSIVIPSLKTVREVELYLTPTNIGHQDHDHDVNVKTQMTYYLCESVIVTIKRRRDIIASGPTIGEI